MSKYKLADEWEANHTAELSTVTQPDPDGIVKLLEKVEVFDRIGFEASAEELVQEFEAETGYSFEEFADMAGFNPEGDY